MEIGLIQSHICIDLGLIVSYIRNIEAVPEFHCMLDRVECKKQTPAGWLLAETARIWGPQT
jgi:hypothetical protein